ncbi:hypothetical protein PRUPE_5G026900 [Prunus persica]|uniref:HAT C-terminal dimerisation domain-containing protein n=1 Tax=Prunus persica TaxID=3760 RepID=A0A251P2R3_PRUPE|nr:hypothetical protein PRUPE_5G026900 [Prunus persica]
MDDYGLDFDLPSSQDVGSKAFGRRHEDAQARVSPGQMLLNADAAGNLTNFVYDHDIARKELVNFIIRAELPFKFVDSHDFKGLIQRVFCPQYKGISASTYNASNNDSTASILPSTLLLDSVYEKLFHVRCCCHILNLIVQDGLKVLSPSIDKIIDIVRSMNSSNKRHEIWVKCCSDFHKGKKNIDIDVPHRWNSTYKLLHVAIKYKAPLHRYVQKVNESRFCNLQVPSEEDWTIAQLVSGFLQIFYSSTKIFSEFPMVFCLATIMDYRFKLFAIAEWLNMIGIDQLTIDTKILALKTLLFQLFDIYKKNVIPEVVDDNQFSLLGLWKNNKSSYPIVSLMARDLLTVPASIVASESCFSAGGRVVSEKRASLSPSTIEALICLKDWALADSRKQDAAVDEQQAEELMNIRASRPDWMADSEVEIVNESENETIQS